MTVYGYVRVSTTEQVDNTSMHEQRRQIEGNALTHNLVISQFIEDGGVSGADPFLCKAGGQRSHPGRGRHGDRGQAGSVQP